jgi:hypothetical protein
MAHPLAAALSIFLASSIAWITLSAAFVTITTTTTSVLLLPILCHLVAWFGIFCPKVVVVPRKCVLIDRFSSYPDLFYR